MNNYYEDDPSILDEDSLWRRVPPCHFVPDHNEGVIRPSSAAFTDHQNGTPMSVSLAKETVEAAVLEGHPGFALAAFSADSSNRSIGFLPVVCR